MGRCARKDRGRDRNGAPPESHRRFQPTTDYAEFRAPFSPSVGPRPTRRVETVAVPLQAAVEPHPTRHPVGGQHRSPSVERGGFVSIRRTRPSRGPASCVHASRSRGDRRTRLDAPEALDGPGPRMTPVNERKSPTQIKPRLGRDGGPIVLCPSRVGRPRTRAAHRHPTRRRARPPRPSSRPPGAYDALHVGVQRGGAYNPVIGGFKAARPVARGETLVQTLTACVRKRLVPMNVLMARAQV